MTISNIQKVQPSSLSTGSGSITANGGSVQLEIDGAPSVVVNVSGTWQLDLVVQTAMIGDGSDWSNPLYLWEMDAFPSHRGHIQLGMNAISGAQQRNGNFRVETRGAKFVRVFAQAAGGTPGSASVSITASPVEVPFPVNGYNVLAFDAVLPTASRTSPVHPAPPNGWRWDNAETTDGGTQTSWSSAAMQVQLSDTYSFAAFQSQQSVTVGPIGVSSYLAGENAINGRQANLSNWIRWVLTASVYSAGTARVTISVNFVPPLASPFGFDSFRADQATSPTNSLMPDIGALTAGIMPWAGALLLATDAAANTNGGKMRRLRVDPAQALLTGLLPPAQAGGANSPRVQRNLGALAVLSGFANNLYGLSVMNNQGAAAYIQVFDSATTGAVTLGTTVPKLEYLVAATSQFEARIAATGVSFANGIVIASTTTELGASASAAGVHLFAQTNL